MAIALLAAIFSFDDAGAQQPVELELVLAIDASTSVDPQEFRLQREGLAAAFVHPQVINAIRSLGGNGIAVTVIQWAGTGQQTTSVPWTQIRGADGAAVFSSMIESAPRAVSGMTDIGNVIRYAAQSIASGAFSGRRRVIDISGDGAGDQAGSSLARDQAVKAGIVINGLVIHNEDYDLGELGKQDIREHYQNHVIGGAGAFLMTAADFEDFRIAIRRKLVREILGPLTARL